MANEEKKPDLSAEEKSAAGVDDFMMDMGIIAHEIKSPLAAAVQLLNSAEFLLSGAENDRIRRLVKRAKKRIGAALDLNRNLLEYIRLGRAPAAEIGPDPQRDFGLEIRNLIRKHLPLAEKHHVRIISEIDPAIRPVMINPYEFSLIFDNLLSNAIRYSKRTNSDNRVWVRAGDRGDRVILEVADEGIGMTETDRERVFGEFFRSNEAREQTVSGSGLGMAIVKKLCDECGAKIACQSVYGEGSTFTVEFPLAK